MLTDELSEAAKYCPEFTQNIKAYLTLHGKIKQ
jgi:hypothetical protein